MKVYLVVILAVACLWCCEAQSDAGNVYCGRHLSRVLASICWGSEEKRGAGWWGAEQARALGARGKRGLVNECCYKPCTLDEMLNYC